MAAAGRLIVFKVGSSTLVDEAGSLDRVFIRSLCDQVVALREAGNQVVVVSSGAAAAGRDALGLSSRPSDMATLQACASVGQTALTEAYAEVLRERGVLCGQVLLTRRDVVDRDAYLNARNTLTRLLELGAVPVVNENDTVSVAEFTFGDNDMLGAIVSALVGADLYIILSDVCGLYTANPSVDPTATLIPEVTQVDRSISAVAGDSSSSFGTGGMSSKVRAARGMMAAGIPTVICEGRRPRVLLDVAAGKSVGTRFRPPADAHAGGGPQALDRPCGGRPWHHRARRGRCRGGPGTRRLHPSRRRLSRRGRLRGRRGRERYQSRRGAHRPRSRGILLGRHAARPRAQARGHRALPGRGGRRARSPQDELLVL